MSEIRHIATVEKVQTLADGGLRVTLDLPEAAIVQAAEYMTCKQSGLVIDVISTPRKANEADRSKSVRNS